MAASSESVRGAQDGREGRCKRGCCTAVGPRAIGSYGPAGAERSARAQI